MRYQMKIPLLKIDLTACKAPTPGRVSFQWKNPDFLLKNPDFLMKNLDFLLNGVDIITKQRRRSANGSTYA